VLLESCLHSGAGKFILPFFQSEPSPERWIFIVGCYNSGTTLLETILASHPEIQGLPKEGVFLTDELAAPRELGWPRMWMKCQRELRVLSGSKRNLADKVKRDWSIWLDRSISNVVEKSVSNTVRLDFLRENFSPSYFIYIIRNGYAVAEGIRRKSNLDRYHNEVYDRKYPIALCARQWEESDRLVREMQPELSHFHQLYYEELTKNPRSVLNEITSFLGIPSFRKDVETNTWTIQQHDRPLQNLNKKHFQNLSMEDIQVINDSAAHTLDLHGYEPPDEFGDRTT